MSKIDDLRGKLAERKGKSADTVLRASSAENPLSQEEILKYAKENGGMLFLSLIHISEPTRRS